MKNEITKLISSKPKHFSKLVKNNPILLDWVNAHTIVNSDNMSEKIYSAITQSSNRCNNNQIKKFKSITEGYKFCGPAGICECAAKSVSEKVSNAKSKYTDEQTQIINKKRANTTLQRYGVSNNGQTDNAKLKHADYYQNLPKSRVPNKSSYYEKLNSKYKTNLNIEFVTDEINYHGVTNQIYYKFKCLTCSNRFSDYIDNGHNPVCKICNPYTPAYSSKQEIALLEYVKSITSHVVKHVDKSIINPYELDIVVPELKIAIEYCGLYWHSEANKADKKYHLNKMSLCNANGYRLITVFEDEWTQKTEIVKNRLQSIFGKSNKIYARNCQVSAITKNKAKEFILENHIQGDAIAKFAYGCFCNNELVAVMTFGKPRYAKDIEYELIRYCSKGTVVGGAGKLFATFVREVVPNSVVSYCDMRWGTGDLYSKLNFNLVTKKASPGYSYTDFVKRYHRSKFTKSRIITKANINKTEHQIMREKKMYRIWDCGHTKWLWTY